MFGRKNHGLADAIAHIAEAQRVEPITLADRLAAVDDALHGASEDDAIAVARAILNAVDPDALAVFIRDMDRKIWAAMPAL